MTGDSRVIPANDAEGVAHRTEGAVLDLGCGGRKHSPTWVGIDSLVLDGVDIVGDVFEALGHTRTSSVAGVYASHFCEHIDDVTGLLAEMARVTRPGGEITIIVPHFSNAYFYSDPTHKTAFGLYSMAYFIADSPMRRQVPVYGDPLPLVLEKTVLGFKSTPPFYVRHAVRRLLGAAVNSSRYTQEFYEENLSGLLSCYELRFSLRRI